MEEKIIYWANTAKTKFTSDGLITFNRIFKNNPTPTDEDLSNIAKELESDTKTIREKFRRRHRHLKTRKTPTKKKVVITKAEKNINDDKQRSTTFLKNLNNREAKLFMNYMINEDKCIDYINNHHVPKSININDIWKMTSDDHRNGEYFSKWMRCLLPKEYETSLPPHNPRLSLNKNGTMPSKLQDKINSFCRKQTIAHFNILKHHIVLRATDPSFTNLTNRKNAKTGSHLCDTNGCVLSEHLVIENFDINLSRTRCQGVTLLVRLGNETSVGRIIQAAACRHGIINDDGGFKNSCRKLKIYVQDETSINYCKSLLKK
ncbi:unnamed protein product [Adineta steineri]|uniref:Zinc-binding loop region of homing endonuclease domain-containing protein n=1 Tax=Adineta steineri TaxID=433720 RepID=A0A816EDP0_9BILA|nr:unnamed protein product [Adineta steineri]CAF1646440.1 unnamed protein product [Adineta steineri]